MNFFTFSLPILAMPFPERERLQNYAIADTLYRAGLANPNLETSRVTEYVRNHPNFGFKRHDPDHHVVVRGAIVCGVSLGHCPSVVANYQEARRFISAIEVKHGPSPLVFISAELFWRHLDDGDPDYRLLSTLCAVNSIVGFRKAPVLVRRDMIIARQLGYKTPAVMRAELDSRKDQVPLTVQQLRDALNDLESRELVFRCQASPRCVYFSTTLDHEALRAGVKSLLEKKQAIQKQRIEDRELFENHNGTIKEPQKNHLKRDHQKRTITEPLKNEEPQKNHNGTTAGTTTGTAKRNGLNEMALSSGGTVAGCTPQEWQKHVAALKAAIK